MGGLRFKASLGKKLPGPYFKDKSGMVVSVYNHSYTGGRGRRIVV
jgi:hypothetical protein